MDGESLGRRVPDRCVPTLDDGVEVLAVTNQFRLGNVAYGHLTSQTDWTHKMLVTVNLLTALPLQPLRIV
jgi:hypothetical protein